jgi:DNA-binding XRE family transcriptional regulator
MDEQRLVAAVARTVRAGRRRRGWSQDELSARAGVSKGAVVALERAQTSPNLSTLCRVGDALGLGIAELLEQPPGAGVRIVDPGELTPLWRGPNGGTAVVVLVTGGAAPTELWRWRLHPGERYEHVPYALDAGVVKALTVVNGTLRLVVDGVEHELRRGAAATFDASAAHAFHGVGRGPCELLSTTHLPPGSTPVSPRDAAEHDTDMKAVSR